MEMGTRQVLLSSFCYFPLFRRFRRAYSSVWRLKKPDAGWVPKPFSLVQADLNQVYAHRVMGKEKQLGFVFCTLLVPNPTFTVYPSPL